MGLKILSCFLLFFFLLINCLLATKGDSIKSIYLSDHLEWHEAKAALVLVPMDHYFFDTNVNKLMVGFELYRTNPNDTFSFVFLEIKKKSIQQFRLRPLVSKMVRLKSDFNSMYVDSLELPPSKFGSGNYELIVNLMSDSLKVIQVKKQGFQLLRSPGQMTVEEFIDPSNTIASSEIDIGKSFVAKYTTDQLMKNIQALEPKATNVEKQVIKELNESKDLTTMRRFFYNFWFSRNADDPEKAWNEYAIILNELAKKYGTSTTPGYETDRGRIYIKYGPPDRAERVLNEKGALPYELWFYYRSGSKNNLRFLFFQPGMIGNQMILLHSNQTDEIINQYWKELLFADPNDGDNKLIHKAYEFFK